MSFIKTFEKRDDFGAMYDAEEWLRQRGFSVGSPCRGYPRGILHGDYQIAKWRNLDRSEIIALHGVMRGNARGEFRGSAVTVEIFDDAPADAIAAFKQSEVV